MVIYANYGIRWETFIWAYRSANCRMTKHKISRDKSKSILKLNINFETSVIGIHDIEVDI